MFLNCNAGEDFLESLGLQGDKTRKTVLKNLFTGQQWRNKHREETYGLGERGGEGELYQNSNMGTYITICKIDSQREFAVWLRKLKQGPIST